MAIEFVTAVINELEASGIGEVYATSGISLQDGYRRGAPEDGGISGAVALLRQTAGVNFPRDDSYQVGIQILVDAETVSGARAASQTIYNFLHEKTTVCFGTFRVLWMRANTRPQDLGDGPGGNERYQVSTNYNAHIIT